MMALGCLYRPLGAFLRDERGSSGVLVLSATVMLFGAAAIAIDLGAVFLAKRELQGVADAAVVVALDAAAGTGEAAARDLIDHSEVTDARIIGVTDGTYTREAGVDPALRFTASETEANAIELRLEREVTLFFYRALTGQTAMTVTASAIAARQDRAAFSIGSRLGAVSGGAPNAILSALAGEDLQLSIDDLTDLDATTVDLLVFADALRSVAGRETDTYGEVLDDDLALASVVAALADAVADADTAAIIDGVAGNVGTATIRVADFIDLGPFAGTDFNDGTADISVSAMGLLRAALQASHRDGYAVTANLAVPGLTNTKLAIVGGNEIAHSPWISVASANDVTVRTARMRVYLETTVATGLTSIATIKLPVFVELAEAEARLADIHCATTAPRGVTLAVTPSIGTAAIASVDAGSLDSLTVAPALAKSRIAHVAAASVRAYAELNIGGASAESQFFSAAEIDGGTWKSTATDDAVTALATSLVHRIDLEVTTPLGPLLVPTNLKSSIAAALVAIAPTVDGVLNDVTRTMGVRLGIADTRVDAMRCGTAILVA